METVVKQFPEYTPYPAEYGRWRPNQRMPIPGIEEYEKDETELTPTRQTVDVNLWERIKGDLRMRKLPDLPLTPKARAFYHGVAAGVRPFSERGARGCLSRRQFRRLRDLLEQRGKGHWKDDDHHEQGFVLSDDILHTFKMLGKRR